MGLVPVHGLAHQPGVGLDNSVQTVRNDVDMGVVPLEHEA